MTRRPEGIPEAVWQKFVADSAPRDAAARERGVQAAEAMLGRPLPEDLRVAGWSEAPEGSIFEPGLQALAAGEGNVFERLVDEAGRGNHEPVLHWLTGCHYYGDIESDGDCLFMALPSVRRGEGATTAVVRWSHEEGMMAAELAPDLACFGVVWDVWNRRDELGAKQAKALVETVAGRWHGHWPLGDVEELIAGDDEDEGEDDEPDWER